MATSFHEGIVTGRQGRYRLVEELHRSEMSVIYVGKRLSDGLRVVVKFPRRKGDRYDGSRVDRLRREIEVLRSLSHENIVRYVDEGADSVFLVMEHVEGVPLTRIGRMEQKRALKVFKQVMGAVSHLHEKKYVHGDIKPGNVILRRGDRPVLIDFGTARRAGGEAPTELDAMWLTGEWAAPEQLKMRLIVPETDIYQLGELLFYMLTGENPKKYMGERESLDPRRLTGIEGRAASFIARAMAPTPAERYRSIREAMTELFLRAEVVYKGVSYEIGDRLTIGRKEGNDLVVEDPRKHVHGRHCIIYFSGGRYYIEPCTSEWSERVNYPYVRRGSSYTMVEDRLELHDRDVIALCYNPMKGPYIELPFRILNDC